MAHASGWRCWSLGVYLKQQKARLQGPAGFQGEMGRQAVRFQGADRWVWPGLSAVWSVGPGGCSEPGFLDEGQLKVKIMDSVRICPDVPFRPWLPFIFFWRFQGQSQTITTERSPLQTLMAPRPVQRPWAGMESSSQERAWDIIAGHDVFSNVVFAGRCPGQRHLLAVVIWRKGWWRYSVL